MRSQRRTKKESWRIFNLRVRSRNDKEREGFSDAKFDKEREPSKSSDELETGVLSNMLKYEASMIDENGSQVIRVQIWGIRKWTL